MADVHVVYTDFGDHGWGVTSPQYPTLVAGYKTIREAIDGAPAALQFAGMPADANLITHEQKYVQSPDGVEYFLRFLEPSSENRDALMGRAIWSVEHGTMDEDMDRMPTTPTGERIVITCEADDLVGWVLDQLGPGEGATVERYGGEDAVYSVPVYDGDREGGKGTDFESLDITRESTVEQMIDAVMTHEAAELRAVTQRKVPLSAVS